MLYVNQERYLVGLCLICFLRTRHAVSLLWHKGKNYFPHTQIFQSKKKSQQKRDANYYVSTCYLYYVICTLNYTPKEARTASILAVASASQRSKSAREVIVPRTSI